MRTAQIPPAQYRRLVATSIAVDTEVLRRPPSAVTILATVNSSSPQSRRGATSQRVTRTRAVEPRNSAFVSSVEEAATARADTQVM